MRLQDRLTDTVVDIKRKGDRLQVTVQVMGITQSFFSKMDDHDDVLIPRSEYEKLLARR